MIVDVETSTAIRQAEVTAAKRMIEQASDRHGLWPRELIGKTGYDFVGLLARLVHERGIERTCPSLTSLPGVMVRSSAATSTSITG